MFRTPCLRLARRRAYQNAGYHVMRPDGPYRLQRVRFVRPWFSARRSIKSFVYTGLILGFLGSASVRVLGLDLEDEEDDAEDEHEAEHRDEDDDAEDDAEEESGLQPSMHEDVLTDDHQVDEDAIFIPLGWARHRPIEPYKGTDPEWQEFMKFAQDHQRGNLTRKHLAVIVAETINSNRYFRHQMGSPIQLNKYWLDVDFPYAPPPEYERAGLEIGEEYISWTTRPVSSANYGRLQRALNPGPLLNSAYATITTIFHHDLKELRERLGIERRSNTGTARKDVPYPAARPSELDPHRQRNQQSDQTDPEAGEASAPPSTTTDASPPGNSSGSSGKDVLSSMTSSPPLGHWTLAYMTFRSNLARTWRRPVTDPPRGSIIVSGLVELVSPRAMAVVDVVAAFSPKHSRWEVVNMQLRRFQWKNQVPKG